MREVRPRDQEHRRAQEDVVPEPVHAFDNVGADVRRRLLANLLERGPHEEQGHERRDIRDGVGDERDAVSEREEEAAEGLADDACALLPRLVLRDRLRQLLSRHDLRERGRLRRREEQPERSLDERDDDDLRERQRAGEERDPDARECERAQRVGDEHDPLAVAAIDGDARGKREQVRQHVREADEPGFRRRVRRREDEQWKREPADLGADRRDDLARPEDREVAVLDHAASACSCCASTSSASRVVR